MPASSLPSRFARTRGTSELGESLLRPDGTPKARGEFAFSSDLSMDGMLWGRTLRSPHASARIESIDVTPALAMPGVRAVIAAEDVPGAPNFGLEHRDQPVFAPDVVRYHGEPVAAVAADHPDIARRACAAIEVRYTPTPPLVDAEAALTAPPIHPDGNVIRRLQVRHGDPDAAGELMVEGTYEVGMQDQAFMGPESGLAVPADDGGVELYIATQWLHVDRDQVAACLGLAPEQVHLTLAGVGGAFGAREDVSLQVHLCLLALRTGRPVKMLYSREESFFGHVHRHPARLWYRHHATRDGQLVKVEARLVFDGGAYASSSGAVIANAACFAAGPYRVPNATIDGYAVRTNNPPCGAMRGFGAVQVCFAHEAQMDKLAAAAGLDPVELRLRNALARGDTLITGQVITGTAPVAEVIRATAELPLREWPDPDPPMMTLPGGSGMTAQPGDVRRGVGFAVGFKNLCFSEGFDDYATARVGLELGATGEPVATVHVATAEVGQGFVTLAQQIARAELGVPDVLLHPADTAVGSAGSTSASRQTMMSGGAVQAACGGVREALLERVARQHRLGPADLELADGEIVSRNEQVRLPLAHALADGPVEVTREYRHLPTEPLDENGQGRAHVSFAFAAHRAAVDVDPELGLVRVVEIATAQDVGKALNPLQLTGQLEGGIAQGVGLAVMEEIVLDEGRVQNPSFTDYLIPTALDVPDVAIALVEQPEPGMPYGAKGAGEPPTISSTAAVAAAIRQATGVAVDRVPVRPQDIALATATATATTTATATAAPGTDGEVPVEVRQEPGPGPDGKSAMRRFTLNGVPVEIAREHPHLLAALREELSVTSPKDGCSPSGQCGCCTVLVDGKAQASCLVSLDKAQGKSVTTLEALSAEERERFAATFAAFGALQCGFCTPGILMRTKALIDKKGAALTRDETARHLGAHLCRRTGYVKILDAGEALAAGTPVEPTLPRGVGSRGVRYESAELALGDRGYVDDIILPGMLHAALRLADYARADVVRIDTGPALAVPGVVAVYTGADVPGELRVGLIHTDWPVFIPEGGRTSYLGDVLAIVVAADRETARRASRLIDVEYRVRRPLVDAVAAVHDAEDAVWGLHGNVLSRSTYARGDVDEALESCAHVVREVFHTQRVEHAFLEPESTVAAPQPDGLLKVWSGGQGVWDDRNQIAAVLGVPKEQILVELVSNGGAFGGKEDMSNQAQTALAAFLLDRPVKCTLSREQSLLVHAKRHPIRVDTIVGCDADGRLVAQRARMIGDSGPYASVGMKVLERAAGHASGPYVVPNIDVEALAVRTNNPVCGAFRGFGANQAQFAMEGAIDRLAEMVGISGWEMRARNVIDPGAVWGPGQIMDEGCRGARACLDAVKPHYDAARDAGKAVGLGLGLKNSGLGNGFKEIIRAAVRFEHDGTVEVRHCWTEMGQGIHTVALQVAVEELGVDPTKVRVVVDTTRELGAGQTTGSRGTLMGAGAVADACRRAIADGRRTGVDYVGEFRVDWTNSIDEGLDHPVIHSAFGYAAQVVIMDRDSGVIERVVAAHDVGRAVNPTLCEGQIEGAVHMGLGYALSEDFPTDGEGRPTHMTLRSLGILRAKDVPAIDTILVEVPQPNSPYGIKGVGEIGLVPTSGAVAAALHELDGRWRTQLPLRREAAVGESTP